MGSGADTPDGSGGVIFTGSGTSYSSDVSSITFSYQGTGSGTLTPGIYATWNFNVSETPVDPSVSYSLIFDINGTPTTISSSVDAGVEGTNVSSSKLLNYTVGQPLSSWSATFTFSGVANEGLGVDYADPINIIVPNTAAPEPAAFLLVGPALALFAWRGRRMAGRAGQLYR